MLKKDIIYNILLIDDDDIVRKSTALILGEIGFSVIQANGGLAGIKEFLSSPPDLVLLDLCMPEIDGIEVLAKMIKINIDIPVIMISGRGQMQDAIKTLTMGAWDYITKPVLDMTILDYSIKRALERSQLIVENKSHQEHLEAEVKRRTLDLEKKTQDLSIALKRVEREMIERQKAESKIIDLNEILEQRVTKRTMQLEKTNKELKNTLFQLEEDEKAGRAIQFQLLPDRLLSYENYFFYWSIIPSMMLSGDFLGQFRINNDYIGFYLADVSGHGVSSAFITVMLYNFFDRYQKLYTLNEDITLLDPATTLKKLNEELLLEKIDKYLTIFFGIINTKNNTLTFSNAGQFPFPLLITEKDSKFLRMNSYPIGLFDFSSFNNSTIDLPEKFSLLIISDGILEMIEKETIKEQEKALVEIVGQYGLSIDNIIANLGLNNAGFIPDDITLMLIQKEK